MKDILEKQENMKIYENKPWLMKVIHKVAMKRAIIVQESSVWVMVSLCVTHLVL